MATAGEVLSVIQEVEALANSVLAEVAEVDPALKLPTAAIEAIEGLANAALSAWSKASGVATITVAEVQALKVNINLDAPTA